MPDYIPDLEKAIAYIEENIKNSIAVEKVASFVNFSYYHFHRLFFSLTGEILGDYIRKRRLSEAAEELICNERKIIDIALDYNFESQEAFTRSFKNMFGMTPAAFRKKGVKPIINQKDILLGEVLSHRTKSVSLKPNIVRINYDKTIVGIKGNTNLKDNKIKDFWKGFYKRVSEIQNIVNPSTGYGICFTEPDLDFSMLTEHTEFTELVGVEVEVIENLPEGMDVRIIKSGYYAVFRHEGSIDSLRETYKYIWTTWLCNSEYSVDLRDDFEVYKEDFLGPYNDSSVIWIYIPVKIK